MGAGQGFLLGKDDNVRFSPLQDKDTGGLTTNQRPQLTVYAWDETDGTVHTANSATDAAIVSATSVMSIQLIANIEEINRVPVLAGMDHDHTPNEDTELALTFTNITTNLSATITDNNSGTPTQALVLFDFVTDAAAGTWHYSDDGGSTTSSVSVPSGHYLVLENDMNHELIFRPNDDYYHVSTLMQPSFKVAAYDIDAMASSTGTVLDPSTVVRGVGTVNIGNTPPRSVSDEGVISMASLTYTLTYQAVNDPPSFAFKAHRNTQNVPAAPDNLFNGTYDPPRTALPELSFIRKNTTNANQVDTLFLDKLLESTMINLGDQSTFMREHMAQMYAFSVSMPTVNHNFKTLTTTLSDVFVANPTIVTKTGSSVNPSALSAASSASLSEVGIAYEVRNDVEAIIQITCTMTDNGSGTATEDFYLIFVDTNPPRIHSTTPGRTGGEYNRGDPFTVNFTEAIALNSASPSFVINNTNLELASIPLNSTNTSILSPPRGVNVRLRISPGSALLPKLTLLNCEVPNAAVVDNAAQSNFMTEDVGDSMTPAFVHMPNAFSSTDALSSVPGVNSETNTFWLIFATRSSDPPQILSSTPANLETDVSLSGIITITFDEGISLPTTTLPIAITSTTLSTPRMIYEEDDTRRGTDRSFYRNNNSYTLDIDIDLQEPLPAGELITITIPSGTITGIASQQSNTVQTRQFTTLSTPNFDGPTSVPVSGSDDIALTNTLTATYDGTVTLAVASPTCILAARKRGSTLAAFQEIYTDVPLAMGGMNTQLSITLPVTLSENTEYEVRIPTGMIADAAGNLLNPVDAGDWSFTTVASVVAPLTPTVPTPQAGLVLPEDPSSVPVNESITLSFDHPVEKGTAGNIFIHLAQIGEVYRTIPVTSSSVVIDAANSRLFRIEFDNTSTSQTADDNLPGGQVFYVTIDAGAFRSYANTNSAEQSNQNFWRFTTSNTGDITPPAFVRLDMPDGGFTTTDLSVLSIVDAAARSLQIRVTFDEPILYNTGNITITQGSTPIETIDNTSITYSNADRALAFTLTDPLNYNTTYTLNIPRDMFTDAASRGIDLIDYDFTTRLAPPSFRDAQNTSARPLQGEDSLAISLISSRFTSTPAASGTNIVYAASGTQANVFTEHTSLDRMLYNNLRWARQTSTSKPGTQFTPGNNYTLTFEDLGFASNQFNRGQVTPTAIDSDMGIHTYHVWQEDLGGNRLSDTTVIDLVILERAQIVIELENRDLIRKELTETTPTVQNRTEDAYHMYVTYNDIMGSSIEWGGHKAVSYTSDLEVSNDLQTIARFISQSVDFPMGANLANVTITLDLTNTATERNYRFSRSVQVSANNEFLMRLTKTTEIAPPSSSISFDSICQNTDFYDISELMGTTYTTYNEAYLMTISNFKTLRVANDAGLTRFLEPASGSDSWRIQSNQDVAIAGEREITINRILDLGGGTEGAGGFAVITLNQAPDITILNVMDRYCASTTTTTPTPAHNVEVRILRNGPADSPIIRQSNVLNGLAGTFNIYAKATATPAYNASPDDSQPASGFQLDPNALYTDHAGGLDSVIIKLEYISAAIEDVGPTSSCQGRGEKEFIVYARPDEPDLAHDASAVTFVTGGDTEALYCENENSARLKQINVLPPLTTGTYRWFFNGDLVAIGNSYTPLEEQVLSTNIAGNTTIEYDFDVTLLRYVRLEEAFQGCESTPSTAHVRVIGVPEVSLDRVVEVSTGTVVSGSTREICVARVNSSVLTAPTYDPILLRIVMQNTAVLPTGGTYSFTGSGATDDMVVTPGIESATFDPIAALKTDGVLSAPQGAQDYLDRSNDFTVRYVWNNNYGPKQCSRARNVTIKVNGLPSVIFQSDPSLSVPFASNTSVAAEVCVDRAPFQITSVTASVNPSFYVDGVLTAAQSSMTFNPDAIRDASSSAVNYRFDAASMHTVTYIAENAAAAGGCSNFAIENITIFSVPDTDFNPVQGCQSTSVTFNLSIDNESNLPNGMRDYLWTYPLSAGSLAPTNQRTFTEPTRQFTQSFSSGNVYTITVAARTNKGCTHTISKDIDVGTIPNPEFFWEGGTMGSPLTFHLYEKDLPLSRINNIVFRIEEETTGNFVVGSLTTRAKPPVGNISLADITKTINTPGVYNAIFSINSVVNCEQSITRQVHVFPKITIDNNSEYVQKFFPDTEGWYADTMLVETRPVDPAIPQQADKPLFIDVTTRTNSWAWGTPNPESTFITQTADGADRMSRTDSAWLTNARSHLYARNENSWLYSPAFDISALSRPTVSFDIIYQFNSRASGVVLQYSPDDGSHWYALGDYTSSTSSTGVNWYTHDLITSIPGEQNSVLSTDPRSTQNVGWAGVSVATTEDGRGQWIKAKHKLEIIPVSERSNIRFRFAMASADEEVTSNGVGIDNFKIGDREKIVLVEEFSSEVSTEARALQEVIDNYLSGKSADGTDTYLASQGNDVIRITYYGYPQNNVNNTRDRLYHVNAEDVNTRQVYYGVSNIPTAILEGDFRNDFSGAGDANAPPWTLEQLNRVSLSTPDALVSFKTLTVDDETVDITIETSLTEEGIAKNIEGEHRVLIAIIERDVELPTDGVNGQMVFRDVMRKLLPDAAGTIVSFDATDTKHEVNASWQVTSTYLSELDPSMLELYAIAFVQDVETKRIYQAAIQEITVSDILELGVEDPLLGTSLRVFPNPANQYIEIAFGSALLDATLWQLIDTQGSVLKEGIAYAVDHVRIHIEDTPTGHYTLRLSREGIPDIIRHIIVRKGS